MLYLDDGIVAVQGEETAKKVSQRVRLDLVKAGLVEHSAKYSWVPSHQTDWLGFSLDLERGVISIPEGKIVVLKTQLEHAATKCAIKARDLASIIGKIISMSLAIGPVSRLMTR